MHAATKRVMRIASPDVDRHLEVLSNEAKLHEENVGALADEMF
jgi:hypothetical protein